MLIVPFASSRTFAVASCNVKEITCDNKKSAFARSLPVVFMMCEKASSSLTCSAAMMPFVALVTHPAHPVRNSLFSRCRPPQLLFDIWFMSVPKKLFNLITYEFLSHPTRFPFAICDTFIHMWQQQRSHLDTKWNKLKTAK
jgi:hypothetical protein